MDKSPEAFRTISEVGTDLDVPQHVLRFWETKFSQIKPMKRAGGRRYYRPNDVDMLRGIRHLLYDEGYTIRGVQKLLREHGAGFAIEAGRSGALPATSKPEPALPKAGLDTAAVKDDDAGEPHHEPEPSVQTGLASEEREALAHALKELDHARALITGSKSVKPF